MRKACFIFLLVFASNSGIAQDINFELDFSAEYWAPKSKDTVKVKVGNKGRYIFTDSEQIAKAFGSLTRRFQPARGKENATLQLLFDMETTFMLMNIQIGSNTVMAHIDLSQFMNRGNPIDSTTVRNLTAAPTALKIENRGKRYKLFAVAPDNKPDDVLHIAFDEKYPIDYGQYFSKLMSFATGELFQVKVPEGLPVYVEDEKGEVILELLSVKKNRQKGSADLQMKLE